ncbi:Sec-independent protein translocase protein TatA [Frankia canadensis]|uniref:Sec-independent protein translocase protein TatA n=1 Tax=Frankia canadensis TaxID=1836972 RepID=A0A2I2KNX0_9ACTN|nr:Sec-independent protein translocase subunit TatA [Frankia canadensis]SNQ47364.1 Sec-independent protein translocase protein TatA [Frankia canadensis]SOU54654.1 Sec-independent protein translocase protein TatA [Frankia canadensis]
MPDIGAPELLIILLVVVVLFGAKRLPDAARSLGRSMRIFKSEVKGLREDDQPTTAPAAASGPPAVAPAATAPAAPAPPVVAAPAPQEPSVQSR